MILIDRIKWLHKWRRLFQNWLLNTQLFHFCSKLFDFKWAEMGAFRCFKVSKHKIYNILSSSALFCQVGSANFLFMELSMFINATLNLQNFFTKNIGNINKHWHLFSSKLEPVALFQIRSGASVSQCLDCVSVIAWH